MGTPPNHRPAWAARDSPQRAAPHPQLLLARRAAARAALASSSASPSPLASPPPQRDHHQRHRAMMLQGRGGGGGGDGDSPSSISSPRRRPPPRSTAAAGTPGGRVTPLASHQLLASRFVCARDQIVVWSDLIVEEGRPAQLRGKEMLCSLRGKGGAGWHDKGRPPTETCRCRRLVAL